MQNREFIELLKTHTNIDYSFINTFFRKFKIGHELDFDIKDEDVARYLNIQLKSLRERLNNTFAKYKHFYEKVDYIKIKSPNSNAGVIYMLNYPCFERLAMGGDSEKSEVVRSYFIKLRQFLTEYQEIIYQAMENKKILKQITKYETVYFFVIDERHPDIIKYGRATDIINRLNNYNVGRIKNVDLKYLAIVKNSKLIEQCIKLNTKKYKYDSNREILKIEPDVLKKVIDNCYCKYVNSKEHNNLYGELSQISGLYNYVKNKKNIKPFIIIDK